jgi:hypothetical protein
MADITNLVQFATVVLGSSVLGGLLTAGITGLRDSAAKRRDGYAIASKALLARSEFPYRVRRRTSDAPETLAMLTRLENDIQEQLAAARGWISGESSRLADIYERTLRDVDSKVRPATEDAWRQRPITQASEMNLGEWGPGNQDEYISAFGRAVRWRFGLRRLVPMMPRFRSLAPVGAQSQVCAGQRRQAVRCLTW